MHLVLGYFIVLTSVHRGVVNLEFGKKLKSVSEILDYGFLKWKGAFLFPFSCTSMLGKVGRFGGPRVNYSNRKKQ